MLVDESDPLRSTGQQNGSAEVQRLVFIVVDHANDFGFGSEIGHSRSISWSPTQAVRRPVVAEGVDGCGVGKAALFGVLFQAVEFGNSATQLRPWKPDGQQVVQLPLLC